MNWKTVLQLVRVDMKAGRVTRGQRLIHYNVGRNRLFNYLGYGGAVAIGVVAGILVSLLYNMSVSDALFISLFKGGFNSFMLSLPTIMVVVTLVFTMMQLLARSGTSSASQAPYWLPVTWQEHTLANIITDVVGLPLVGILLVAPAILVVSVVTGQVATAIGCTIAMFLAAIMAGATVEIFRILQVRFIGAVYKSSGKAAILVRFAGTLIFFLVFYIVYFYVIYGTGISSFITTIASIQSSAWFVPFVWLGMTLFSFVNGMLLEGIAFLVLSLAFIARLYLLSVALNSLFGLYEPPAITVSKGVYAPKTGRLGKLGFTAVEAALIRKDLKAFTRRRELMASFILPIVFMLVPIMSSFGSAQGGQGAGFPPDFGLAFVTLFPTAMMALSLGNFMTGEEGQNIWRIYVSPVSAKNFVKSKYTFMMAFCLIVLPITASVGIIIYQPSLRATVTLLLEGVFIAFAAGSLSLANGIKGADFNEVPKPRMIRSEWSLINMICGFAAAVAVILPLLPYALDVFVPGLLAPFMDLYLAITISGVIAAVLTGIFYSLALSNAKELLAKAEV
jgi:hypothetical protein